MSALVGEVVDFDRDAGRLVIYSPEGLTKLEALTGLDELFDALEAMEAQRRKSF